MSYRKISDEKILASAQYASEEKYWLNRLSGELERTNFPYDNDFKNTEERHMETIHFSFSNELFSRIMRICGESDSMLHMVLTASVLTLLGKYSYHRTRDSITGTPVYKQEIEGDFLNTMLILRNRIDDEMSFKALLLQVRQTMVEAVGNQNYPFELLLERLNIADSPTHPPYIDIFILLENIQDKKYIRNTDPNLIFSFVRLAERIELNIEYNEGLYRKSTIQRLAGHLNNLLNIVLFSPDTRLKDVDILPEEEKKQLLIDFNRTESSYPEDKTIHQLFEEQAQRTPEHVAVSASYLSDNSEGKGSTEYTYRQLDEKSNRLAHFLRSKGVNNETITGLLMEPSLDMMTGILGVLKAGSTYLPISPEHPQNRIKSILEDSRPPVILTQNAVLKNHSFTGLQNLHSIHAEPLCTPECPAIKNLDSLPMTDRSLVSYEKYNQYIGQAMVKHSIAIQGTRGCPYNCAYCHKIWPKRQAIRSAENLYAEVKQYYDIGVRRFVLIDDIFNLDVKNSTEFFQKIIHDHLDIQLFFPNGLRGDILTKDYIDLMVEAGTINVALALETASPRLQKLIQKNLNLDKFQENLTYFQTRYPQVILELFTMHGFPTETEEEAMMTLDFIKRQKWLHFPYVHILKIFPNTGMAKLAIENGVSPQAIAASTNLAYHQLPDTLPFDKSFTLTYQANFLNDYFLSKERLRHVLPYQMKSLTHDELVEKYDSYLPSKITNFNQLLEFTEIRKEELGDAKFLEESKVSVPDIDTKIRQYFPKTSPNADALRILFLDLSQFFSGEENMLYDVVEPPLGLMALLSYLNREFGNRINGRIAKSRIDFNNYTQLKQLLDEFQPDVIGIRTLTFYKDFLHQTVSTIRNWGIHIPILSGGPYATSDFNALLQDRNLDLVVLGEGEIITAKLVEKILEHGKQLPPENELKQIPGIAFVPENKKKQGYLASEVIPIDSESVLDTLQKYPAHTIVNTYNKNTGENSNNSGSPSDPAYIIFTSGSTGKPKGVMIEHRNVARLLFNDKFQFDFNEKDIWTMFHSYCFDFSVWEMYGALLYGGKLLLIPRTMARDTERFLDILKKEKVTVLNQTPSAFYNLIEVEMTQKTLPDQELKLRYIVFGGEALNPARLKAWHTRYPQTKLVNMFGITETTVHVTYKDITEAEIEAGLSNIGQPIPTLGVYTMDTNQKLLPLGVPGELCVGGLGVARGYLNRVELTSERFTQNPYKPYERLYRSGDMARILENGDMVYLGRLDQQVQIRGFRVELGEIENQLMTHPRIKEAVVIAREMNEDILLCAYLVLAGSDNNTSATAPTNEELREKLAHVLPDYMIPSFFITVEKIPLTSNGKVDRKALPDPSLQGSASQYIPPRDHIERKLVDIWVDVLESDTLHVSADTIGINDNFFELGGHSLKATIMISKIHKEFEVKIPLVELFQDPTIEGLAENIRKASKQEHVSILPFDKQEYYPTTFSQNRLYFMQQTDPETTAYNIPLPVVLEGNLNREQLENAFRELIRRHDSFRTSFHVINGTILQKVHEFEDMAFSVDVIDRTGEKVDSIDEYLKAFDLSKAPLLTVKLVRVEELTHILVLDFHHIITDGFSTGIFIREFMALYGGETLPPPELQYRDYAMWMSLDAQKESIKKQEAFWHEQFASKNPTLEIPTDFARPTHMSFEGGSVFFDIPEEETRKLKNLALETDVTLFILLLSVFNILLSKLSGTEDIVVGTAVTGRRHADLENVIGMFVNTLALRNYPEPGKTVREFLKDVGKRTLQAFENQDYPFESLVEKLNEKFNTKRDRSRNPVFDVMFELQNIDMPEIRVQGLTLKPFPVKSDVSKFDMTLNASEMKDQLYFSLSYNKDLFRKETMEKYTEYFKKIVTRIIDNPERKLSQIDLASGDKGQSMRTQFNESLEDE